MTPSTSTASSEMDWPTFRWHSAQATSSSQRLPPEGPLELGTHVKECRRCYVAHDAWVAITHPNHAGMHAARHLLDETTQITLESATGAVRHYQRCRRMKGLSRRAERPAEEVPPNNEAHSTEERTDGHRSTHPAPNVETHTTSADATVERHTPESARPSASGPNSYNNLIQCVNHVTWPRHAPWANPSWNNQQVVEETTQAAREVLEAFGGGTSDDMVHALGQWIIDHVKARRQAGAPNHWRWPMTFTCWIICIALRHTEAGSGLDCRTLLDRFSVTAGGARQNPFQRWRNAGDTRNTTFEPGTPPLGARS